LKGASDPLAVQVDVQGKFYEYKEATATFPMATSSLNLFLSYCLVILLPSILSLENSCMKLVLVAMVAESKCKCFTSTQMEMFHKQTVKMRNHCHNIILLQKGVQVHW
jgi:hypothetical protein